MGLDGYVIACNPCICWNHNGANGHDSEWSHLYASHGRGLIQLHAAGSMWDPHQVLAQDLCLFSRRTRGIHLINVMRCGGIHTDSWPHFSHSSHAAPGLHSLLLSTNVAVTVGEHVGTTASLGLASPIVLTPHLWEVMGCAPKFACILCFFPVRNCAIACMHAFIHSFIHYWIYWLRHYWLIEKDQETQA